MHLQRALWDREENDPGAGPEQLLHINEQRFRGGLACKAHRLLYHSTLGLRETKVKKGPDQQRRVVPFCFTRTGYECASLGLTDQQRRVVPQPHSHLLDRLLLRRKQQRPIDVQTGQTVVFLERFAEHGQRAVSEVHVAELGRTHLGFRVWDLGFRV